MDLQLCMWLATAFDLRCGSSVSYPYLITFNTLTMAWCAGSLRINQEIRPFTVFLKHNLKTMGET